MDLISDERRLKASAKAVGGMLRALNTALTYSFNTAALEKAIFTAYQGQDGWWYGHLNCGQGHYMITDRAASRNEALGNAQDMAHVLVRTYS